MMNRRSKKKPKEKNRGRTLTVTAIITEGKTKKLRDSAKNTLHIVSRIYVTRYAARNLIKLRR